MNLVAHHTSIVAHHISIVGHHEVVVVIQGVAGVGVAGLSAVFLTSWSAVRHRISSRNGDKS
jgi:hypothetical protein